MPCGTTFKDRTSMDIDDFQTGTVKNNREPDMAIVTNNLERIVKTGYKCSEFHLFRHFISKCIFYFMV
jgi:hypothetical protein